MTWDEPEDKWGDIETKIHAKWGNLTRAERRMLVDRRQKRPVGVSELYDLPEKEVRRAIVVGHRGISV